LESYLLSIVNFEAYDLIEVNFGVLRPNQS
jgi:hypothetical protein